MASTAFSITSFLRPTMMDYLKVEMPNNGIYMKIRHHASLAKQEHPMNKRFDKFRTTSEGSQLAALTSQPDRLIEFKAFSREGFPAVTALVSEATPILAKLKERDLAQFKFAKQFVGDLVGDIMRSAGYRIIKRQKSVPGKLFSVGAVWGPV